MASDRPEGRTSEVGHRDLEIGRRNHRSLELGQAGTAGQPENMAGAMEDLVTDGSLTKTSGTASIAASPTAADQPTSLSSPLVRPPSNPSRTVSPGANFRHGLHTTESPIRVCLRPDTVSSHSSTTSVFSIMRPNALF